MKLGKEVEGRLKGLRTVFMTADEAINIFGGKGPITVNVTKHDLAAIGNVQAIYISDHGNVLTPDSVVFNEIRTLDLVTSIERTAVNDFWPDDICVLLTIESPSFWYLKDTDQVKFSYEQNVRSVVLENMTVTNPEDFRDDETL